VAPTLRTNLEDARVQFSERLLRLWEQADLIDTLLRENKPTEAAKDLLLAMQKTLDELRLHIEFLVEAAGRPA
jgi:hypothetical protein